ncbi:GNAT family N-acetyltransferase [Streptomyces sp. NPDC093801]|uniref:GNAT family N-acetyltransferase n=1 Tax=Streptomyces sp. NPDC093801 TaxID=3155203 RepID=UPI0034500C47
MEIRPTTDQDFDVFVDTMLAAFGFYPEPPVDGGGQWWSALEMDRCLFAVAADGKPVGTAGAYSFELTLPGGSPVPVSGVTAVGVLPSHRRRGALSALMRHQLAELRARGEFLSVLLASEALIYRRFGYGPATYTAGLTVPRHRAALAVPRARGGNGEPVAGTAAGSIEVVRSSHCGGVLEEVYDRYRRSQPGALSRPHRWWSLRAGQPPISPAPRYVALHRDADGVADGYASYTIEPGASRTMKVDEIITADDAVHTALARFLLEHDLVHQVSFKHVPTDHPLRWQFEDFRGGEVTGAGDWLWVRLLDVPAALTARGWCADGELVLDVEDRFLGERGRHLLTVRSGKADCVPTDREPDLSLDVSDLASVYLGGTAPSTLVRAGHIRAHHPGAAALADALFRAERSPHCLHWF